MAYSEAESLGMKGCSDLVSRARKTMLRLQSLSDAFNELASAIQAKLDAARMNFEAVSNMYSLVSLPTETLASIFECVVNGNVSDTNPTRWMAAVTLSHVCQYFRNAALSCPQLWSNISRSGEMAASCMLRSKEVPLDVELTVAFGPGADEQELHFEQLLRVVVPHSSRWRNLDIQFVSNSRDDDTVNRTPLDDSDFHQIFYEVDAPLLESLHIRNNKPENTLYRNSADFAYWNTPNLRSVTTVHYFPISLYGLENVTTLDITLILNQFNFADLLNDLSWMKNLEDLRLKLEHCSELFPVVAPGDLRPYGWTELPSVRRLRIETEFKDESSSASSLRKFYLFTALCFPGVVDLYVKVSGILDEKDDDLDHNTNLHLEGEIIRILWNPERFPCVESFRLEVCGICNDDSNTREWFESQEGSITLVIPINLLPSLKFFTLHSNRQLYIKDHYAVVRGSGRAGDRHLAHSAIKPWPTPPPPRNDYHPDSQN